VNLDRAGVADGGDGVVRPSDAQRVRRYRIVPALGISRAMARCKTNAKATTPAAGDVVRLARAAGRRVGCRPGSLQN
jgi:hypothetical protein